MLILTRKKDESIVIDGKIEIQVLGIEDGKVKIGIDAPKDVTIHRSEIHQKILEANKEAVSSSQAIKLLSDKMKIKKD